MSVLHWGRQYELARCTHSIPSEVDQWLNPIKCVDKCDYLGTFPDNIEVDNTGKAVKLVEVKCPLLLNRRQWSELEGN